MFSRHLYQTKNWSLGKERKSLQFSFQSKQMCTPKSILPRAVHQETSTYHCPVKSSQLDLRKNSEEKGFQPAKLVHLSRVFLSSHDYNPSFIYRQGCLHLIHLTSLTLEMLPCVCRALSLYWLDELKLRGIQMPMLETSSRGWMCISVPCRACQNNADAWVPPSGADSVDLSWGLRICISNKFPDKLMLLVWGPHLRTTELF